MAGLSRSSLLAVVAILAISAAGCFVYGLNVDRADTVLDETGASSFTQNDAEAYAEDLDKEDEAMSQEDEMSQEEDTDMDQPDDAAAESDMSFLEDEGADADSDIDLNGLDDNQAQEVANSLEGDEREAFLDMWREHKENLAQNGNPDPYGSFSEI